MTDRGRRMALAALFTAGWALPRLPALRSDVAMRDDLVHVPAGHLQSYRPLFFADLWLWNHVVGNEYLLTIVPKILGGVWAVLLALLTADLLRRRSSWPVLYAGIPLLFLSHPIVNELTLFNVVVPVMLSMLLAVAAFTLVDGRMTRGRGIAATLLLTISIAGYQINLTVFAMLVAFAATAELIQRGSCDLQNLLRSAAVPLCAALLYLIYFCSSGPAIPPAWGHRGLPSLQGVRVADVVHAKWHGATNMLADVTQPALSWLISERAGWRAWSVPYAILIA